MELHLPDRFRRCARAIDVLRERLLLPWSCFGKETASERLLPSWLMAASPYDPEVHSARKKPDPPHRLGLVPPHQPASVRPLFSMRLAFGGLRMRVDRHENGASCALHGVEQNKSYDLLLNLGARSSGSTLLMNELGQFGRAVYVASRGSAG
jgi:hypothetical protein